jgi:hypothetical protein
MSVEWVHLSPVILTDGMFLGGNYITPMYSGTAAQRQVAYLAAEQAMIRLIESPLLPTAITGTWMWPGLQGIGERTIVTPHRRIQSVEMVRVLYGGGTGSCGLQTEDGCFRVRDDQYGYLDIYCLGNMARAACKCGLSDIYQVQVAYTAGLPTGIASNDTSLHMALCIVAEEKLNEIIDPGANIGGPGAPGIESYSSLGYSERLNPKSLGVSPLGGSARANQAKGLVRHLVKTRALRF